MNLIRAFTEHPASVGESYTEHLARAVCFGTRMVLAGIGIARLLAVPRRLGLLLAIGTAVCGCTAVVAMAPLIRARHAETAFAVTCVVLFGCIAMLFYPWVASHFLAASPVHAGIFLGTAIHDTSQVIGAALIYSQQAADTQRQSVGHAARHGGERDGDEHARQPLAQRRPARRERPQQRGHGYRGRRLSLASGCSGSCRVAIIRSFSSVIAWLPVRTNTNGSKPCNRQAIPASTMRVPKHTALARCSV